MLSRKNDAHPLKSQPLLTVVIDTEEEFDWAADFNRHNRSVDNIRHQHLAQTIFRTHNIIPTYCVDYPVVEDDHAVGILREWAEQGDCLVGTQLHPWVSPPYDEPINRFNSYAGNLPYDLEREKLTRLTDFIEQRLGVRPLIFKAGRYGVGPNTARIIKDLGYKVDVSVVADTNFSHDFGPNFIGLPTQPYWFEVDGQKILELPNSRGYDGFLANWGSFLYPRLAGATGVRALVAGILARTRLLERIPLTPEGIAVDDLIRMVRRQRAMGQYYFNYAFHSSSLMVGGAPYVRTLKERDAFLDNIDQFFDFFLHELGGCHKSPLDMHALLS